MLQIEEAEWLTTNKKMSHYFYYRAPEVLFDNFHMSLCSATSIILSAHHNEDDRKQITTYMDGYRNKLREGETERRISYNFQIPLRSMRLFEWECGFNAYFCISTSIMVGS